MTDTDTLERRYEQPEAKPKHKPKPERKRVPNVRTGSVHYPAVWNGDRPEPAESQLKASWATVHEGHQDFHDRCMEVGDFGVSVCDMNRRGAKPTWIHPQAVFLFDNAPDYGFATAPEGWHVADVKRVTEDQPVEAFHDIHVITVVFERNKPIKGARNRVEHRVLFVNIGRANAAGIAAAAWAKVALLAVKYRVHVVCPVEVQEGDSYNEQDMVRHGFPTTAWRLFFLRLSRNPIIANRKYKWDNWFSRLVGKAVAHWSPPRRFNQIRRIVSQRPQRA